MKSTKLITSMQINKQVFASSTKMILAISMLCDNSNEGKKTKKDVEFITDPYLVIFIATNGK